MRRAKVYLHKNLAGYLNEVELSPAYDFVNSTITMKNAEHEIALTLNRRTKKITKKNLFN